MLRAELLGGLRVWWREQPLTFPSRQARSLLAYLLTHPEPHPREHLAALYWPDLSDDQARKRLSQTLWQIRQALAEGSDSIVADAESVGWNALVQPQTDLDKLRAALNSPNPEGWKEALELYRGELLRGIYDDWVLEERDHLLQKVLGKLEQLIRHYRARGEPQEALEAARRLAALEPLHDEAHQEVMRLCLLLGKPREALEHFRKAKAALEELGEQPGPELEALRQQAELARESPRQTSSPLEGSGGLMRVGRSEEYQSLLQALTQAQQGQGAVVLVEGEAGMGKSRLLHDLAREGGWRGFGVLQAKASERLGYTPYGLLHEALEGGLSPLQLEQLRTQLELPYLQAVGRVVSALAPGGNNALRPEDESGRIREGLVRLLLSLSHWSPQLLLLDDLHWADEGTLEALPHLARATRGTSILLVFGYRSTEARERAAVWSTVQKLSPYASARVELNRLSEPETAELVRRSLGLAWSVPRFEARVYRETQGNPLFVLETLRSLYEEGLLHRSAEGTWSTPVDQHTDDYGELPLAPTVRQVIVERLKRLPQASQSVANALAVLAVATLEVLAEAVEKPRVEVLNTVATLVRQGLLVEREGKLAFAHDKIGQAAYEEMDLGVRKVLHRRVGEVLEGKGALPEELAGHFEQAGLWAKAALAYRLGGERAEGLYALSDAVESYAKAYGLAHDAKLSAAEQIWLLNRRTGLLGILDRNEELFADLNRLEQLAGDNLEQLCDVRNRRASTWVGLGHIEKGRQEAQWVLEQAAAKGWKEQHIRALGILANADQRSGNRDESLIKRQAALELSIELGDNQIEAESRHLLAVALIFKQQYIEAKSQIKQALKLMPKAGNLNRVTRVVSRLGPIWQALGNPKAAEAVYRHVIKVYRMLGSGGSEASNCINWAQLAESRGQIALALSLYSRAIEVFTAEDNLEGEASARVNLATLQAVWLADQDEATKNAQIAQRFYTKVGDLNGQTYCEIVLALLERNRGEVARAYQRLSSEAFRTQGQKNRWLGVQLERFLSELSLACGDLPAATKHLELVEHMAQTYGMAVVQPEIVEAWANIRLVQGNARAALDLLALPNDARANHHRHFLRYQAHNALSSRAEALAALQQAKDDLQLALEGLSPEQVQASLECIPEHRLIIQAWEAQNIQRQTFRIPIAGAPTGRPLRDDEYLDVAWTIHTPEDQSIGDKTERRQVQLERIIGEAQQQGAAPTVDDLAAALDSSKATIKRDLTALRAKGVELKTRGSRV